MKKYDKQVREFLNNSNIFKIHKHYVGRTKGFRGVLVNTFIIEIEHRMNGVESLRFEYQDSIANTEKVRQARPSDYDILTSISRAYLMTFDEYLEEFFSESTIKDYHKALKEYESDQKIAQWLETNLTPESLEELRWIV